MARKKRPYKRFELRAVDIAITQSFTTSINVFGFNADGDGNISGEADSAGNGYGSWSNGEY